MTTPQNPSQVPASAEALGAPEARFIALMAIGLPVSLFLGCMCFGATLMLTPRLLKVPVPTDGNPDSKSSKPEVDS